MQFLFVPLYKKHQKVVNFGLNGAEPKEVTPEPAATPIVYPAFLTLNSISKPEVLSVITTGTPAFVSKTAKILFASAAEAAFGEVPVH